MRVLIRQVFLDCVSEILRTQKTSVKLLNLVILLHTECMIVGENRGRRALSCFLSLLVGLASYRLIRCIPHDIRKFSIVFRDEATHNNLHEACGIHLVKCFEMAKCSFVPGEFD